MLEEYIGNLHKLWQEKKRMWHERHAEIRNRHC